MGRQSLHKIARSFVAGFVEAARCMGGQPFARSTTNLIHHRRIGGLGPAISLQ
jgi:hypothetical protein